MRDASSFELRVHRGRNAERLPEIAVALSRVFPEARASYLDRRFAIGVLAPAELEPQIRSWFEVILHV